MAGWRRRRIAMVDAGVAVVMRSSFPGVVGDGRGGGAGGGDQAAGAPPVGVVGWKGVSPPGR
ncbi:hypothetical protein JCM11754A_20990 [Isoptericola variabilis]